MLSIVIPCQEDEALLFPTLKSIFKNNFNLRCFEVILICNKEVHVPEKLEKFSIKIHKGGFKGQAQALNYGLTVAHGEIFCTTKPGCIVASNWLSKIVDFFQRNPDIAGVGGPVFPCLEYGTRIQKIASQIFYEEQEFPSKVIFLKPGSYKGLLHATNSAFQKEIIASMGFDESFKYDYDFDICWRMTRKGYRLAYNPEMRVRYIFPFRMWNLLRRYYHWGKESIILRRKHSYEKGIKDYLYIPYGTIRSFFQPSPFISRKKLLRLIQHVAFDMGCFRA